MDDGHEILAAIEVRAEPRVSRCTVRVEFVEALTQAPGVVMGSQRLKEKSKSRWPGLVSLEVKAFRRDEAVDDAWLLGNRGRQRR